MSELRFSCTPAGRIAVSRVRIRRLLLGMAVLMAVVGVWMFWISRWGPGLICAGAMVLCWFTWQMSGDLDPLWLTIEDDELSVQMRRQRQALPLRSPRARRLTDEESAHLDSLASASGVMFATASYESHLLGAFDLFATNLDTPLLVEVDAAPEDVERDVERWIVTPDDPTGFLAVFAG
ncbi:MAG: hypothetical protein VYE73_19000 [Acidobacteriota bacterium]|nr:hypothetical protein [Acidobacteriota bacterium]